MSDQDYAFEGNIPENYDRYLVPMIFDDYGKDLANRAAAAKPNSVLEIAAGTGSTTKHLLQTLGNGTEITVSDFNGDMLEVGRKKHNSSENLTFEVADATALPFDDNSFDTVLCQFGIMFFPDKVKAISEVKRVLRPGGSFIFSTWEALEKNELTTTVADALTEVIGGIRPTFYDVPFGMYDHDELRSLVKEGGLNLVGIENMPKETPVESPEIVARGFIEGSPMSGELVSMGHEDVGAIASKVAEHVAAKHGNPPTGAMMEAIIVTSKK